MKKITFVFIFFTSIINSYSQQIVFVKDSIIDEYMRSGFARKTFRPEGKIDTDKQKQGFWKDYDILNDFAYATKDGKPKQLFGHYLLYGEGEYVDGKREKDWKIYVIEDKTFKKVLQEELSYMKGLRSGPFKYFFANGTVGIEGKYLDNYFEGEMRTYYEDGKLYGIRQYKHGLRVGKHSYVYPDGKPELEANFVNDTLNGLYQTFYPNGTPQEVFSYDMGKINGVYKYYFDNGQLWVEKEYKDGLLWNIKNNFDKNGNARDKGTLIDGDGAIYYYTEEGKVYSEETYKNGRKINEISK